MFISKDIHLTKCIRCLMAQAQRAEERQRAEEQRQRTPQSHAAPRQTEYEDFTPNLRAANRRAAATPPAPPAPPPDPAPVTPPPPARRRSPRAPEAPQPPGPDDDRGKRFLLLEID